METLIKEILKFGLLPAFLLILLFLIIQEPDRATKFKALITAPFFRLFKWFSKEHISSKVSSQANEFLNSSIFSQLTNSERYNVKVKWVKELNDPYLTENGTLIIRMKEEADQTKNILTAVNVALPLVLCPLIRKNINKTFEKSIDLAVLKKLANKLGKHGKSTFKRYFLDPETEIDSQISNLIVKLQSLDEHGFFIPIFINELELLSEGLYADNDYNDYSDNILQFLEYLLKIVNREIGQEIELEYYNPPFKVSTIMLAKAQRADTQGLKPYLKRLKTNLDKGSETVYIISFPPAFDFFKRLLSTLESHDRVFIKKVIKTQYYKESNLGQRELKIAKLTRKEIFTDELFEKKLLTNNIIEGSKVKGIVEDISHNETLVNILGMKAYIKKNECSWLSLISCDEILRFNQEYDFIIKKIDKSSNMIYLTMKTEENNPWNLITLPKIGDLIDVVISSNNPINFSGIYSDKLELYIPNDEISWFFLTPNQSHELIGTTQTVKVISIDDENEKIFCSLRQIQENPWPLIHESLKVGMEFNGKVTDITHNYIQVKLPNNYIGTIPSECLEKAGHEYKNFQENVVIGQGIDVFVTKVFIERQRIRLDLIRNKK